MTDRALDLSKPVIWTSEGNLNEDDLEKFCDFETKTGAWICGERITRDPEKAKQWAALGWYVVPLYAEVICVVGARLKSNGKEVKRGAYVLPMPPRPSEAVAANFL
jgi:hypothetical protein